MPAELVTLVPTRINTSVSDQRKRGKQMPKQEKDKCPHWCINDRKEDHHEHHSELVVRNSFSMELLRYYGDDITQVTFMTAREYGEAVTLPVDTLIDFMGEVRQRIAIINLEAA